ncbi:hypothetical protein MGH68_16220 [Erysipelothrix sp. D19-032]
MKKIACPCCNNYTIYEEFDICPVCFREHDTIATDDPAFIGGANGISLNEAIQNYRKYKVSDIRFLDKVREPYPDELCDGESK